MKYLGNPGKQAKRRRGLLRRVVGLALIGCVAALSISKLVPRSDERDGARVDITLPGQSGVDITPVASATDSPVPFEPSLPAVTATVSSVAEDEGKQTADEHWSTVTVAPGDNLSLIFSRLKLSKRDLHFIAKSEKSNGQLRKLKPGQTLRIRSEDGRVDTLVLELDALNSLWVEKHDEIYSARVESIQPEIRISAATTDITQSLFVDGQKVGLSDALIMNMTEIFGWDIDFALDIRKEDRFGVIYEEIFKDGTRIKQGRILAAEFLNRGKRYRAVLYTVRDGKSDYYSEDGHAMRKAFLRTPVNFTRISSRFNLRRRHPVLNTIRAHRGVDYAAPIGTPVRATANGQVRFAGRNGGYGRVVELRHGSAYGTLYAHLSRITKGMKRGVNIRQGQIIGYVGKSGLATGPHLHYEFQVNGVHRNPLTVDLPKAEPLAREHMPDFKRHAERFLTRLDAMQERDNTGDRSTLVAQLDAETLEFTPATRRP